METRKHLAAEKKRCNTHNCTQAVVGTGKSLRDCPDCVADASEFLEEFL